MTQDTQPVPLTAKARLELASMAYVRWAKAYDAMKEVKALTWDSAGRFCPKGEWPLYHAAMVKTAQTELDLATALKDEICPHSPLMEQLG